MISEAHAGIDKTRANNSKPIDDSFITEIFLSLVGLKCMLYLSILSPKKFQWFFAKNIEENAKSGG